MDRWFWSAGCGPAACPCDDCVVISFSFPSQSISSSLPSASLAITKSLEPVVGLLSNTVTAKLTSVEATLKDNVTKVVKSKVSGGP